jgi:hypothetical protein
LLRRYFRKFVFETKNTKTYSRAAIKKERDGKLACLANLPPFLRSTQDARMHHVYGAMPSSAPFIRP